jgi:hypothetical protein
MLPGSPVDWEGGPWPYIPGGGGGVMCIDIPVGAKGG